VNGSEFKDIIGGQTITDAIMSNSAMNMNMNMDMKRALNSKVLGELAARSATPAEYARFAQQDVTTQWLDSKMRKSGMFWITGGRVS